MTIKGSESKSTKTSSTSTGRNLVVGSPPQRQVINFRFNPIGVKPEYLEDFKKAFEDDFGGNQSSESNHIHGFDFINPVSEEHILTSMDPIVSSPIKIANPVRNTGSENASPISPRSVLTAFNYQRVSPKKLLQPHADMPENDNLFPLSSSPQTGAKLRASRDIFD